MQENLECDAPEGSSAVHGTMALVQKSQVSSSLKALSLGYWWLLDSGASRSVVSDRFLHLYEIVQERKLEPPLIFSTASGERVKIDREVKIRMKLGLLGPDGLNHSTPVVMRALVSPVEHNLLSVGQVARQGWCFNMDQSGCKLTMKDRKLYPVMWGSCP